MDFKLHNGGGGLCCKGCSRQNKKLNTYDWLADIPGNADECDMVEVQFKNTRKGYYKNSNKLALEKGDIVAVEATPGHDIGEVTLTGQLVPLQMRKANLKPDAEIKRIYRKAKPVDMEKYEEAKAKEHDTMIRSRQIAASLNLQMKIGDVEYQGDGNKAIFYYIADERVDFRQLIKVLAEAFRVRIEMKQIGARQEAGRIGGIGPCGRELCCATWMTSFISVSTSAARFQDISLNPQKLAGQCAKLKCCLNYEVDCYVEAQRRLPSREVILQTQDQDYYFFKADILSNQISYSTDKGFPVNLVTISGKRAFEIIGLNKKGIKPETLEGKKSTEPKRPVDLLEQESLTRFDRDKRKKENSEKKNKKKKKNKPADNPAENGRKPENTQPVDAATNKENAAATDSPQTTPNKQRPPREKRNNGERAENNNRNNGERQENSNRNNGERAENNNRNNGERTENSNRNNGERAESNNRNNGERAENNNRNNGERAENNNRNNGERAENNNRNNGERTENNNRNNGERTENNNRNNGERTENNKRNRQGNRPENGERPRRQDNRPNNNERPAKQGNRPANPDRPRKQENRPNNGEKNGEQGNNQPREEKPNPTVQSAEKENNGTKNPENS